MTEAVVIKKKTNVNVAERSYGTGRRKEAVARVWVYKGTGKIIVNGIDVVKYFARPVYRIIVNQPFSVTETSGAYDILCTVSGGGLSGQAGAIRLGVARALKAVIPTLSMALRKAGFLTRDSRVVERKKYGRAKARKRFQFSKR